MNEEQKQPMVILMVDVIEASALLNALPRNQEQYGFQATAMLLSKIGGQIQQQPQLLEAAAKAWSQHKEKQDQGDVPPPGGNGTGKRDSSVTQ